MRFELRQLRLERFPAFNWRAAVSAVSSGRVLNEIAAPGADLWTAFTTISNSGRLFGESSGPRRSPRSHRARLQRLF